MLDGPADNIHALEGATNLAESGILLPMPPAVHSSLADVGLFGLARLSV